MIEYLRFLPEVVRKKPIQLTFFVTRKCNSACSYCFYLRGKERANTGEELSLREIEKIAENFKKILWLALSGGEIFLRDDIDQVVNAFYKNAKPSIILLPTNGTLPEVVGEKVEEILKICRKSNVVVKLSIDALGEEHDRIRGFKGNFAKLMETYNRLAELKRRYRNLDIGVNTVYSRLNQDKIEEIIDFVKGLDAVSTHTLSLVRGDLKNEKVKEVDMERFLSLSKKLESCRSNTYSFPLSRLKTSQDRIQDEIIFRTATEKRRIIKCFAGKLNLVITETGDVYPCEILPMRMGNLRDFKYNLKELLDSEMARSTVGYIARGECYCTHECYMITNILFNPSLYPRLILEWLKLSL